MGACTGLVQIVGEGIFGGLDLSIFLEMTVGRATGVWWDRWAGCFFLFVCR